jgi:hypothetical protein
VGEDGTGDKAQVAEHLPSKQTKGPEFKNTVPWGKKWHKSSYSHALKINHYFSLWNLSVHKTEFSLLSLVYRPLTVPSLLLGSFACPSAPLGAGPVCVFPPHPHLTGVRWVTAEKPFLLTNT